MPKPTSLFLKAHINFYVHWIKQPEFRQFLSDHLEEWWPRFAQMELKQLLDTAALSQFLQEAFNTEAFSEDVQPLLNQLAFEQYQMVLQENITWGEVLNKQAVDQYTDFIAQQEKLREAMIETLLGSTLYSQLMSDVLYYGIKTFFLEENPFSKMPGVGALMKIGKKGFDFIEPAARSFIQFNIGNTLNVSKQSLNQGLSAQRIRQIGHAFWENCDQRAIQEFLQYLDFAALNENLVLNQQNWMVLKEKEQVKKLIQITIEAFVGTVESWSISRLLTLFSVKPEQTKALMLTSLIQALNELAEQKVLESCLRDWLEPFYKSDHFQQAYEQAAEQATLNCAEA